MTTEVIRWRVKAVMAAVALSLVPAVPTIAAAQDAPLPTLAPAPPPEAPTAQSGTGDVPLTTAQKYSTTARWSFAVIQYPWYATVAGVSEATHGEAGYGFGFTGYGKRYATAFADGTIQNFMVEAVLPSMLHADPRYFPTGTGTVAHRIGYAVSRLVVTPLDSGRQTVNISELAGTGLAATLAIRYHPREDRTAAGTLSLWRRMIVFDALANLLKEFWPDLLGKF
jgi:hypothetical protein